MRQWLYVILVLVVVQLACRQESSDGKRIDFSQPTVVVPTQTAVVVHETVEATVVVQSTVVVQITPTPARLCVVVQETVYLRPSASEIAYPIQPLPDGTELFDLGGRSNGFYFVKLSDNTQGWVYSKYIGDCK